MLGYGLIYLLGLGCIDVDDLQTILDENKSDDTSVGSGDFLPEEDFKIAIGVLEGDTIDSGTRSPTRIDTGLLSHI